VPFTDRVLEIRSLADSIRDLKNMTFLYPNIPMHTVFEKHMTPTMQINVRGNYVMSELRMSVLTSSPAANQIQNATTNYPAAVNENQQT
jgi:hypothetical protein